MPLLMEDTGKNPDKGAQSWKILDDLSYFKQSKTQIQIQTPTTPGKTTLCNDDINQKLINMDIIIYMYIVHVLPPDVFFLWERCFGIPQEPGSHLIELCGSSGYRLASRYVMAD